MILQLVLVRPLEIYFLDSPNSINFFSLFDIVYFVDYYELMTWKLRSHSILPIIHLTYFYLLVVLNVRKLILKIYCS